MVGGNQLCRETIAIHDEADDLPNLIQRLDREAEKKLTGFQKHDRRAFEDHPGHFIGVEHYTDNELRIQRGLLKVDINRIGQKIDYVGRTRIGGGRSGR